MVATLALVVLAACAGPASTPAGPPQRLGPVAPNAPDGGLPGTVFGDTDLKVPADIERLRGARVLRGTLSVVRTALESLDGLELLTEVDGLVIADNARLRSLQGLNGLERVRGDAEIRENGALLDVDALARLAWVDGALAIGSDQIANWDPNARKILGYTPEGANDKLAVVRLPALTRVGALRIRRNPLLATLDMPRMIAVDGDLEIAFNPKLTRIDGLSKSIARVGGELVIGRRRTEISYTDAGRSVVVGHVPAYENDTLADVSFPQLTDIGALRVARNPALATASFAALSWMGAGITVDDNEKLAQLDLGELRRLNGDLRLTTPWLYAVRCALTGVSGDIVISGGTRIRDLSFLARLTTLEGRLQVTDNAALREITALRGVGQLGALEISSNGKLRDLAGLDNVARIRGAAVIMDNASLESLDALAQVTSIGEELVLWQNDRLESFTFAALERIGGALDVNGGETLRALAFPKLTATGMFQLSSVTDSLVTFSLPALRDVHGAMYLLGGPRALDGVSAIERIDGDLTIMSSAIRRSVMQAFVDRVRARRGIGGVVQLSPLLDEP